MLTATELKLNQIAQGFVSKADGIAWFESLGADRRAQVLRDLARLCSQSHPRADEVPQAIAHAQLKDTDTACVLLAKAAVPERALHKIIGLPASEQVKAFRLLMELFAIADARRRATHCKEGCSHEWHNLDALETL